MSAKYIKLACGPVFIDRPDWANFDFVAASGVQQADLLGRLPLTDNSAQLVYSSHFLEHIPKPEVETFLRECLRILKPGGVIRLVLPDLENMSRSKLSFIQIGGEATKAWLMSAISNFPSPTRSKWVRPW